MNIKKLFFFGFLSLALVVGGAIFLSPKSQTQPQVESSSTMAYEYYWGEGCSHCQNVADFLESWEKKDKIEIDKKEVFSNQVNQVLMAKRLKSCSLDQSQLAVPFLYTPDGQCLTGDEPIIDYFRSLSL